MRSPLNPFASTLLAGLASLLVTSTTVLAQAAADAPQPLKPPTPGTPDSPPMIWNVLLAVVIVALVVGVSLIPSKRGHQD
jgi:hypothetical protein